MSQTKNRIEQLKQKCEAHYRSSKDIHGGAAVISVFDKEGEKHIDVQVKGSTTASKKLQLKDIEYVKMKDFTDKSSNQFWVLAVGERSTPGLGDAEAGARAILAGDSDGAAEALSHVHTAEEQQIVQHIFQFTDRDKRDMWDHGLRTAVAAATAAAAAGEQKGKGASAEQQAGPSKFHPVKQLTLQQPTRAGLLVVMKIDLENSDESPILEVTEAECSPDDIKRLTNQFIDDHHILPTENTSLYRYIRSVVQRAQMERETAAIVEEINAQRFELLVQDPKYSAAGKLSAEDSEKIVADANAALAKIAEIIPKRIGQHGSGATIVNTILKRNVEKMKLINEMAAKVALADSGAPAPSPEPAAPQV